jgi:hypothetical protein
MASPFSIFRKNQRLWMAGAVLIAILSFVVAPMLQSFSDYGGSTSGRRSGTDVAASWAGGSISRQQLDAELEQLGIANTFLRKLAVDVKEKGGFPQVPEVSPDFGFVGISPESRDPSIIVQRKLLAAEAKRLGIHFDDQSVKTFLQKFVNGKLSGEQIQKTLREVSGGRMSLLDFNRLMREELAKQVMLRVASTSQRFEERVNSQGLPTTVLAPPSKNWQYFTRFNRTANIEVFPVAVNDFETKVSSTPSDRELRDLFEKGKSIARIDMPIQTEPAFLIPDMADFEFIECDIEKIVSEEMTKIPEDVLRAEYERRVKQNQYRVPDTSAPTQPTPTQPNPTDGSKPANDGTPPDPTPENQPANIPEPVTPPASKLPPTLENPGSEPSPDAPKPADNSSQSSALPLPRKQQNGTSPAIQLVSFQDPIADKTPPVADAVIIDPPSTATPTIEQSTTDPATAPVPANDPANPSTVAPPTETQNTESSTPAPSLTIQDPAALGADVTKPQVPPMRIQTFEEVRDGIARETAVGQARRVLDQAIREIRDLMVLYSVDRRAYDRAVEEKDKTAVAPEPVNLQEIADKFGFQFGRTGMVDVRTASTLRIGRSVVSRGMRQPTLQFVQLIRIAPDPYEDSIGNTFVPLTSTGLGSQFIFWKVEHKTPETPSFESAKESVRALWQVQRAAELAEAKAKEIASRVGASSLAESLDNEADRNQVLRPAPFTWLNAMIANFDIQLSNVDGLKPIGNDFMERVFGALPGETVVVPDFAKEVFYVVKVNSFAPNEDELLVRFATAPNTTGVQNAANQESARTLPAWFSNLQKQLGYQGR